MIAQVMQRVDSQCSLVDMPPISRSAALRRAESLVSTAAERPLPALLELRYYQWKKLLAAEEVSGFYQQILGPQDGARLAEGSPQQRLQVIQRWLPKSAEQ